MNALTRVVAVISSSILLTQYAIASDRSCPDDPRAGYSVGSSRKQVDFWILPKSINVAIDSKRSFPNLISRYLSTTRPKFSCFLDQEYDGEEEYLKWNWCSTDDGRPFGGNGNPSYIPNKSGGFTRIAVIHRYSSYERVSCRSRLFEEYSMVLFKEDIPGASQLPYIIISREKHDIRVSDYGSAPQF